MLTAPSGTRTRPLAAPCVAPRPLHQRGSVRMAALVLVATALRLPTMGRAYWVDEGISIGIASHPLRHIPALLRLDGSPPLFYGVLHLWLGLFGAAEWSTHALALLTSLAVIPVAYWSGRTLFGRRPAWCAAALAATNPFLNWFATETRMYPLVCCLAIVAVTFAVRAAERRSAPDAAWAAIAFSALLYTHNWGFYLVFVTAVTIGGREVVRRDWKGVATVIGAAAAVGIAYLPWLPTFLAQARHTAAPWAVRPSIGDLISDPATILGGTLGAVVEPVIIVGVLATWVLLRHPTETARRIGAIGIATIVLGWVAAQVEPSWTSRYLAVGLAPLLIATAGLLGITRIGRLVVAAIALSLVGWGVIGALLPDPNAAYAKSNVAAVVAAVRPYLSPGDLVVVTQTEQLAVAAHYLPEGLLYATPTGAVRDPRVVDWRDLIPRLGRADPCAAIAPQVDALDLHAHVFVINPYRTVGSSGTRWSKTVNADVGAVNKMLFMDRGLGDVRTFSQATRPKPFSAVTGLLFTRTSSVSACR
ncbi:MAG: hypothetical protein NVS1B12_02360 [Acidimicrobiales bacterium]